MGTRETNETRRRIYKNKEVKQLLRLTSSEYLFFLSSYLLCACTRTAKGQYGQKAACFPFRLEASLAAEQRMGRRSVSADCSMSRRVLLSAHDCWLTAKLLCFQLRNLLLVPQAEFLRENLQLLWVEKNVSKG